jgi:hypothetical protein
VKWTTDDEVRLLKTFNTKTVLSYLNSMHRRTDWDGLNRHIIRRELQNDLKVRPDYDSASADV